MAERMLNDGKSGSVRVLVVEDSPVELAIILKALATDPSIEVVGTAANGAEALPLVQRLRPDVICTDYHMPVMDGLAFTQRVMAECPCPILILSISMQPSQMSNILRVIEAGAVDVMPKPLAAHGGIQTLDTARLIEKIHILKGVHCIPLNNHRERTAETVGFSGNPSQTRLICIGSSTGGPQALYRILPKLPKGFPVPIVCVQHISAGFLQGLIEWLSDYCALKLSIAEPGKRPEAGQVVFAPETMNLRIDGDGCFALDVPAPSTIYVPSVDELFTSASAYYHAATVGVLLSGMGRDGVLGLRAVQAQGGKTMVQDEATSIIYGMPGSAVAAGVAQDVLPVDLIAPALLNLTTSR